MTNTTNKPDTSPMEWHEDDLPWWNDEGRLVEVDDPLGRIKGVLVIIEQTPGPYECPIFALKINGAEHYFDPAMRWRFVDEQPPPMNP